MKVAFVTSQYPKVDEKSRGKGGAGTSSKLIVDALREEGVDVDVYTHVGDERKIGKEDDRLWYLPDGDLYSGSSIIGESISSLLHLPTLDEYDIIHTYNVRHLPGTIIKSSSTPILSTFNNHVWLSVDQVQHLREGLPQYTIKKIYQHSKIAGYSGFLRIPRTILEVVCKKLCRKSDRFTVQTKAMKRVMCQSGYDGEKIGIVPNIYDSNFKQSDSSINRDIIYVGRMCEQKGVDTLVKAYSILPDEFKSSWNLCLYGTGPLKYHILNTAESNNLENLSINYSPYQDLPEVYDKAALMIHSSKYVEPFSRTWLEAMGSGTPILSSRNPSASNVLTDIAEFYDPFDPQDLANKLEKVLCSPSLRNQMARSGTNSIKNYKPSEIAEKYITEYKCIT